LKIEQTRGLPVLGAEVNRPLAEHDGLSAKDIQDIVAASVGGQDVGQILQGDRRIDLEICLEDQQRTIQNLAQLPVQLPNGE
ncbi:efflux RND transporter permease subunit, partial [Acinetobacter baumannii]|uniref:efflux RND transporter permease subunit n=1 Tax=Acinetobacter baumannii TaxID=470 RepID=UPI000AA73A53